MSELAAVEKSQRPMTRESLAEELRQIGLAKGSTVIVHSSLSSIGWVCGGEVAVIEALKEVVSEEGTLVMPAHSGNLSDPAIWGKPPVPEAWWDTIRATMPAYDPKVTPTWGMGRIAELFRCMPGVLRSDHPQTSFAAWGRHAKWVTEHQSLDYGMGEQSPLARIYALDGHVLLLGVGYNSNTSFHLGEYRTGRSKTCINYSPIIENGKRVWKAMTELEFRTEEFDALGEAFEQSGCEVRQGAVGLAQVKLFKQRDCVDFAAKWFSERSGDSVL